MPLQQRYPAPLEVHAVGRTDTVAEDQGSAARTVGGWCDSHNTNQQKGESMTRAQPYKSPEAFTYDQSH